MVRRSGRDTTMAVTYGVDSDSESEEDRRVIQAGKKNKKKKASPKKARRDYTPEPEPESESDALAYSDDSDDADYGRPAKKKKKTPVKKSKGKAGRGRPAAKGKKASKSPRGKISQSKTPASKRKRQYYYEDELEEESEEESVEEIGESDFSEDDDDDDYRGGRSHYNAAKAYNRGRGRPAASPKKGRKPLKTPRREEREQFPPVSEMVIESIKALKENPRKGSTISAIKETIGLNWPVNMKLYDGKIKKFLLKALDSGEVVQPKGKGLRGRFTVPGMKRKKTKSSAARREKKLDKLAEEEDYTPKPTKRDEERRRHLEELERQRIERQVLQEKLAHDKAMQPKRPAPKRKEEYVVEAVVGMKEVNGEKYFKVKWEGWPKPTWEEEDNLDGCENLIRDYYAEEKRKMAEEEEIRKWQAMGHYEVLKIMDVRIYKDDSRDFLIRWKHCKASDDSWEPEENLDCPDIIEKFMTDYEKGAMVEEKSLREAPKKVKRLEFGISSARVNKRTGGFRKTYEDME